MGGTLGLESTQTPPSGSTFHFTIPLAVSKPGPSPREAAGLSRSPPPSSSGSSGSGSGSAPLLRMPSVQLPPNPPPQAPYHGTLLIAEDDRMNQFVTSEFLAHFDRHLVTNGLDAVVRVHAILSAESSCTPACPPARARPLLDAVVMDSAMPLFSGTEATMLVRSMGAWHQASRPPPPSPYPALPPLISPHLGAQWAAALPIVAATAHALPSEHQRCIDSGMQAALLAGYQPCLPYPGQPPPSPPHTSPRRHASPSRLIARTSTRP